MIDRKNAELDTRRPLTEGEVSRLTKEFIVEHTYDSNAIEGNTLTLQESDLVLRGLTIDIKFTDRLAYYNAFDEYYVKHNLSAMEKLFAGYIIERLDMYLAMLHE